MESHIHPVLWFAGVGLVGFMVFVFVENWIRRRQQQVMSLMARRPGFADASFTLGTAPADIGLSEKEEETVLPEETEKTEKTERNTEDLFVLAVMAKSGTRFVSYDLLQAISAAGLQFGEMNIFHYTFPEAAYGIKLFSLVSAEEPGDFNLDSMGEFSSGGLMLFMDAVGVPDPAQAFQIMLEKAAQLAEDLDGVLCANPRTPWTAGSYQQVQARLMHYQNHPVL